jgi:hypothetical protein
MSDSLDHMCINNQIFHMDFFKESSGGEQDSFLPRARESRLDTS